jgi:4-amino-4-deoxy-L-arabinose transferase-like glycosyltransferase
MSLPFVQRAYFVDDYYHVTMARGILDHPARPYDFLSEDNGHQAIGWEKGQAPRMVNPPLFHYFLAGVMVLWGQETWKLRTASLVFPIVSVLCLYFIGKRVTRWPFVAAVLMAITPAFWLTSYALLLDSAMLSFLLAALLVFMISCEKRSIGWMIMGGVLMGLTLLAKYVGILILPLVLAWQCLDPERRRWKPGYLVHPVAGIVLLLWGIWGILTYGQMHFWAAAPRGVNGHPAEGFLVLAIALAAFWFYRERWFGGRVRAALLLGAFGILILTAGLLRSGSLQNWLQTFYIDKFLVLGSFLGGGFLFLGWAPFLSAVVSKRAIGVWVVIALALFGAAHSRLGGFSAGQSALLAFFIVSTLAFLWLVRVCLSPAQPAHRFLLIWMCLGLAELVLVMPWTAGRYLLLVLPAFGWGFLEIAGSLGRGVPWRTIGLTTAALSAFLACADFDQAETIVQVAQELRDRQATLMHLAPRPAHHWYYLGDTFDGAQPYLGPQGWEDAFASQEMRPGDLLLKPYFRRSSWWTLQHPERLRRIATFQMESRIPLRVMDVPASAGFYASCWGSLPFAVTRDPLERFELYQVVETRDVVK